MRMNSNFLALFDHVDTCPTSRLGLPYARRRSKLSRLVYGQMGLNLQSIFVI